MKVKYTSRERRDGLGYQMINLTSLIFFAEKFDLKVICDLRGFSYFHSYPTYSDADAGRLLEFHPRIIHNIDHINSIPKKEIFDWRDYGYDNSLAQMATGWDNQGHPFVVDFAGFSKMYNIYNEMPIKIKDRGVIDKHKERVRNSITVHARFGNGEFCKGMTAKAYYKRIGVTQEQFILEMRKHDEDFFVCTDTFSFFNNCKDVFGGRVFSARNNWSPEGCGAGHNIHSKKYPEAAKRKWDAAGISPWDMLCEALIDMELLREGKHIICNLSSFSMFARKFLPKTVLKSEQTQWEEYL
jgi:hypothetical protein